jgi:lipopolysaccharide transport system ATP-binding protein
MMHSQKEDIQSLRQAFSQQTNGQTVSVESSIKATYSQLDDQGMHESFDDSLLPDATLHYQEKGAKISDVKICTLQGEKVNVLVQGREYLYVYHIKTEEDLYNVNFGMLIKTVHGTELGGGAYPGQNSFLDRLPGGKIFQVNWRFKANLNAGVYFTNAGILAQNQDKINYSARIVDAYGFKILPTHFLSTAFVDFHPEFQLIDLVSKNDKKDTQGKIFTGNQR